MNGDSFVVDTNFLIAVHEGKEYVEPFLDSNLIISSISEIELLGWQKLTPSEEILLQALLDDCILIELTSEIRKIAIKIRQSMKIKTPDAIVAATSIYLKLPLVTSDKGFRPISNLELILI